MIKLNKKAGIRSYSGDKKVSVFQWSNFQFILNDFSFLIHITPKVMSESFLMFYVGRVSLIKEEIIFSERF